MVKSILGHNCPGKQKDAGYLNNSSLFAKNDSTDDLKECEAWTELLNCVISSTA